MQKLKPCPFCGATDLKLKNFQHKKETLYGVECLDCSAAGAYFTDEDDAAYAWNMRATMHRSRKKGQLDS